MPAIRARLCFVCLGNICRSPTAEGVMAQMVAEAGLETEIEIDSAGTAAHHVGEPADARARKAAAERGLSLTSRARRFRPVDFDRFDYVLTMDAQNLADLEALEAAESYQGHLGLLRDFDPIAPRGSDVPDPYYGGDTGFEEVLDLCQAACRGLLEAIQHETDR